MNSTMPPLMIGTCPLTQMQGLLKDHFYTSRYSYMRVQPLVLVTDAFYLKRAASSQESPSDIIGSRPPSASNSVNLEDNAWLKPSFVTALARQMKLRYWDSLPADLPLNPMHTIDCLCPCCPKTLSSHSYVQRGRTVTNPSLPHPI